MVLFQPYLSSVCFSISSNLMKIKMSFLRTIVLVILCVPSLICSEESYNESEGKHLRRRLNLRHHHVQKGPISDDGPGNGNGNKEEVGGVHHYRHYRCSRYKLKHVFFIFYSVFDRNDIMPLYLYYFLYIHFCFHILFCLFYSAVRKVKKYRRKNMRWIT